MRYKSSWNFFLWASLALMIALVLLYRADVLKHGEMLAYTSSTARQTMAGISAGVALMAWMTVLGVVLSEWFARKGWNYTQKGAAANAYGMLMLLGGAIPWLFSLSTIVQRWDKLEAMSLQSRGIENKFVILRTEKTRGRHRWLAQCTVIVRDATGESHTLRPVVPEDRLLAPGDSLLLRYLPANPTVFQVQASTHEGNDAVIQVGGIHR